MIDDANIENLCYHCHNYYCDGENSPRAYVLEAVNQGITDLGFSPHSPLKFNNNYSISLKNMHKLMVDIDDLKAEFGGKIKLFKSIEADFIPFYTYSFNYLKNKWKLDYIIGSIHLVRNPENEKLLFIDGNTDNFQKNINQVFDGNLNKAIESYYNQSIEMINTQKPDIIGHLDKIIINATKIGFDEKQKFYGNLIDSLLSEIKKQKTIVEINLRAKYQNKWHSTNPESSIIKKLIAENIPIIISTDAHKISQINLLYNETLKELKKMGLKKLSRFHNNNWQSFEI